MYTLNLNKIITNFFAYIGIAVVAGGIIAPTIVTLVYDYNFLDVDGAQLLKNTESQIKTDIHYQQRINPDIVENKTQRFVDTCKTSRDGLFATRCVIDNIEQWVYQNIDYQVDYDVPEVQQVLNRGHGDCQGKALVFVSMVESVDWSDEDLVKVDSYFVDQPRHICVFYRFQIVDEEERSSRDEYDSLPPIEGGFFNCLDNELKSIQKVR